MANLEGTVDVTLTDVNGDSATTKVRFYSSDATTLATMGTLASTIAAQIGACSNAKVTGIAFTTLISRAQISAATAPPPANAVYPSVTDGARLTFTDSSGTQRAITIPAPLLSDFITGSNTVNPSDTNVAALIAELEGLTDVGGSTNLFSGGVKTGRHSRKRATRKHL